MGVYYSGLAKSRLFVQKATQANQLKPVLAGLLAILPEFDLKGVLGTVCCLNCLISFFVVTHISLKILSGLQIKRIFFEILPH